eukprot:jgi/Undpi1/12023/HiC_scaffold_4.g01722.m1
MTENVVDCDGTILRLDMEGEDKGRKPSHRQNQERKSTPASVGRAAWPGGGGSPPFGHVHAGAGAHRTEKAATSAGQTARGSAPQINSMEDFISSGHEEEEMGVGGLPACFDPPPSVGGRRDAEGGGRASPREGRDAAEDVDDIESYPSEAERIREEDFEPPSPGDGGDGEVLTSRRQRKRSFKPTDLDGLLQKKSVLHAARDTQRMGEFKGLVQSIQNNGGGAGGSASPEMEKRTLELLEEKQKADIVQMNRSHAQSVYDGARLAYTDGCCTKEKVQELWNKCMNAS